MPAASTVRGVLAVSDYESGREMVRGKRPQFLIDQREQIVHGWAVARTRFVESFSQRSAQQHSRFFQIHLMTSQQLSDAHILPLSA